MATSYCVELTVTDVVGRSESDEYTVDSAERAAFVIRTRTRVFALAEAVWEPVWLWMDTGGAATVEQLRRGELVHLVWQLEAARARLEWTVRPVLDGLPVQGPVWLAPVKEAVR